MPLLHQLNDVRRAGQHLSLVDSLEEYHNGDFVCDWVILLNAILALSFHVIFVFCKVLELCLYHDIQ